MYHIILRKILLKKKKKTPLSYHYLHNIHNPLPNKIQTLHIINKL